jgi:hypothetical protein
MHDPREPLNQLEISTDHEHFKVILPQNGSRVTISALLFP